MKLQGNHLLAVVKPFKKVKKKKKKIYRFLWMGKCSLYMCEEKYSRDLDQYYDAWSIFSSIYMKWC